MVREGCHTLYLKSSLIQQQNTCGRSTISQFSTICSGVRAPTMATGTLGWFSTHDNAAFAIGTLAFLQMSFILAIAWKWWRLAWIVIHQSLELQNCVLISNYLACIIFNFADNKVVFTLKCANNFLSLCNTWWSLKSPLEIESKASDIPCQCSSHWAAKTQYIDSHWHTCYM